MHILQLQDTYPICVCVSSTNPSAVSISESSMSVDRQKPCHERLAFLAQTFPGSGAQPVKIFSSLVRLLISQKIRHSWRRAICLPGQSQLLPPSGRPETTDPSRPRRNWETVISILIVQNSFLKFLLWTVLCPRFRISYFILLISPSHTYKRPNAGLYAGSQLLLNYSRTVPVHLTTESATFARFLPAAQGVHLVLIHKLLGNRK